MITNNIQGLSVMNAIKAANSSDLNKTNSNASDSVRNDKSLMKGDALRNNMLASIAFKGETIKYHRTGGAFASNVLIKIKPENIKHSEAQTVVRGNKGYDEQWVERGSHADMSVYYADPDERITRKIKDNHGYIVKYKDMPKEPSMESVQTESDKDKLTGMISDLRISKEIEEKRSEIIEKDINKHEEIAAKAKQKGEQLKRQASRERYQRTMVEQEYYNRSSQLSREINETTFDIAAMKRNRQS